MLACSFGSRGKQRVTTPRKAVWEHGSTPNNEGPLAWCRWISTETTRKGVVVVIAEGIS
jgi:hypothetical protein